MPHITDINHGDSFGITPLHYAATHDRVDLVELLLEHKANLDSKNRTGKSPFDLAVLMKFPEGIALVEQYKVNA